MASTAGGFQLQTMASSAPSAAGARADPPPTAREDAAHASAELHVGAAELAEVPAESRAVLAKVLGQLEGLRGELEELKAGWMPIVRHKVRGRSESRWPVSSWESGRLHAR